MRCQDCDDCVEQYIGLLTERKARESPAIGNLPSRQNKFLQLADSHVLHERLTALRSSALHGCDLCRCWLRALMNECRSTADRKALIDRDKAVIITPLDVPYKPFEKANSRHFILLESGDVSVQMRIGGVSLLEFEQVHDISIDKIADLMARTLKHCQKSHEGCIQTRGFKSEPAFRLLHIVSSELVKLVDRSTVPDASYITLSYCWGAHTPAIKLTSELEPMLRQGFRLSLLPQTLQDAVEFCQKLSIGYIWIDALCFKQDNVDSEWVRESSSIQHIYGKASATLMVCSSANVEDGFLRSLPEMELPITPVECRISGLLPLPCRKSLAEIRKRSPTAERGWVFQEEFMSPAIIYYSFNAVFWSCKRHQSANNGMTRHGDPLFRHIAQPQLMSPFDLRDARDPLQCWVEMVAIYSTRAFTHAKDRLPAMAGLVSLMSRSVDSPYHYGLWDCLLPRHLMWTVKEPVVRDVRTYDPLFEDFKPPSWSWASIMPGREIWMPPAVRTDRTTARVKSDVGRYRFKTGPDGQPQLHLTGNVRMLDSWTLRSTSELAHRDTTGYVQQNQGQLTIDFKHLIPAQKVVIYLDDIIQIMPGEYMCIQVEVYGGLLLLQLVSGDWDIPVFRRVGCARSDNGGFCLFEGCTQQEVIII